MNLQTSSHRPAGSRERTFNEVKAEFMRRAGRLNPFEEIRREDAQQVMNTLNSLDKDHWGEEWSKLGLAYKAKGDKAASAGAKGAELAELYMHGFDACRVGRYPSPVSPGKLARQRRHPMTVKPTIEMASWSTATRVPASALGLTALRSCAVRRCLDFLSQLCRPSTPPG